MSMSATRMYSRLAYTKKQKEKKRAVISNSQKLTWPPIHFQSIVPRPLFLAQVVDASDLGEWDWEKREQGLWVSSEKLKIT